MLCLAHECILFFLAHDYYIAALFLPWLLINRTTFCSCSCALHDVLEENTAELEVQHGTDVENWRAGYGDSSEGFETLSEAALPETHEQAVNFSVSLNHQSL